MFDHMIIHCTATPASMDIGADWIDRVHRRKGWSKCGYHIVITRSGEVQTEATGHRTRPLHETGSHVGGCGAGWNKRSLGITMVGGVKEDARTPENNFTDAQWKSLMSVIMKYAHRFNIPKKNIMGHRDLIKMTASAPKACPCFSVTEFIGGGALELEAYDPDRAGFNWDKKTRPPLERGEKLGVNRTYIVQQGDTLWDISRTYGVRLSDLRSLNKIEGSVIQVGQRLRLLN